MKKVAKKTHGTTKRKRGRPAGSKNKTIDSFMTSELDSDIETFNIARLNVRTKIKARIKQLNHMLRRLK